MHSTAAHEVKTSTSGVYNAMKRPKSLIIVAALFILAGCFYLWRVLSEVIIQHTLSIIECPGILLPLIGSGLLRLRPAGRVCAMALILLLSVDLVGVMVLSIIEPTKLNIQFNVFGARVSPNSAIILLICAVYLAVCVWALRVLTRRDVRNLFKSAAKN